VAEPLTAGVLSLRDACVLGIVQGLTEFLPVSSDGHLALVQYFLTPMPGEQKLAINVALHIGTLAALLVYFRAELLELARALIGRGATYGRSWIGLIVLGTLPAVLIGLSFEEEIADTLDSLRVIGLGFLLTGNLLFLGSGVRNANRSEESVSIRDALVVGIFQASALLPGVSRSGTTISAALLLGIRSDVAAKFSFLLAIPAVAGAVTAEGRVLLALDPSVRVPLAVGVLVSGVTGLAAIALLLRLVRGGKLRWFTYYCWALGAAVLVSAALGVGA
jgi:undecaprenyl-diphosphatase